MFTPSVLDEKGTRIFKKFITDGDGKVLFDAVKVKNISASEKATEIIDAIKNEIETATDKDASSADMMINILKNRITSILSHPTP